MGLSAKQKQILAFPYTKYDVLIADGAIRSGKTSFMTIGFIDDAMRRYKNQRFGICGKTVGSAIKNILMPYMTLRYANKKYKLKWSRSDNTLIVRKGKRANIFEVFGGKDESSFALIQGRTLAGLLVDEVALMPKSFVDQAVSRCSVDGSKIWFNCNPASPEHFFYKEWILKLREKNAYRIHFLLEDNPSLSDAIRKRYENMYPSGVFRRRYILGEWCVADGLVYPFFSKERHIKENAVLLGKYYISVDYGVQNAFSAGLWCWDGKTAYRMAEWYYSGREKQEQLSNARYAEEIKKLAGDRRITAVIVDPSATAFIVELVQAGFRVQKAKNDVLNGIQRVGTALDQGRLFFSPQCEDSIREFGLYSWDEKATDDRPVKENDHAMDDIRYFVSTIMHGGATLHKVKGGI